MIFLRLKRESREATCSPLRGSLISSGENSRKTSGTRVPFLIRNPERGILKRNWMVRRGVKNFNILIHEMFSFFICKNEGKRQGK